MGSGEGKLKGYRPLWFPFPGVAAKELLTMFENIYKGRRVLITGHTGFKGSWLTAWLLS